jgi:hypothetical protein
VAGSVTVWLARVAQRGDRTRILCGRQVHGVHDCQEVVAWRYEVRTFDGSFVMPDVVVLPSGLTDASTPGEYRWSRHARDRTARGENPAVDKRSGPPQAKGSGLAGTVQVLAGEGPKRVPPTSSCAADAALPLRPHEPH